MIYHRNESNFVLISRPLPPKIKRKDMLDKGQDNSRPHARKVSVEALNVAVYDGMWSIKVGKEPRRWSEQSINDFGFSGPRKQDFWKTPLIQSRRLSGHLMPIITAKIASALTGFGGAS